MFNLLFLLLALTAKAEFVNLLVKRDLDLSHGILRSKTSIKIQNVESFVQENYEIPLQFPVDFSSVKINTKYVKTLVKNGKIVVPVKLKPEETATLELVLVFSKVLEPLPKKVEQFEQQALIYKGNVAFFSPYLTKEVTTVVKLPNSNDLLGKLKGPEPFEKQGKEITFGPYQNLEKLSTKEAIIHFYSTNSLLSASKTEKTVTVSQLRNNVNFLEYYTLHHKGAE